MTRTSSAVKDDSNCLKVISLSHPQTQGAFTVLQLLLPRRLGAVEQLEPRHAKYGKSKSRKLVKHKSASAVLGIQRLDLKSRLHQ